MKKTILLMGALFVLLAVLVNFSNRPVSGPAQDGEMRKAVHTEPRPSRPAPSSTADVTMNRPGESPDAAAMEPEQIPAAVLAAASFAHGPDDFQKGDRFNLDLSDGLVLGRNANATLPEKDGVKVGRYTSPEQKFPNVFDSVVLNFDAAVAEGNSLLLEFRTRADDGEWTAWTMVTATQMNELILTQVPAQWLQYRVTLEAPSVEQTPHVGGVRVETRNSRAIAPQASTSVAAENVNSFTVMPRP